MARSYGFSDEALGHIRINNRQLLLGVHNQRRYVESPTVVHLVPDNEDPTVLQFSGVVELNGAVRHDPRFAIICQLEYQVLLVPLSGTAETRALATGSAPRVTVEQHHTFVLRWLPIIPGKDAANDEYSDIKSIPEMCRTMFCGPLPNVDGTVVFGSDDEDGNCLAPVTVYCRLGMISTHSVSRTGRQGGLRTRITSTAPKTPKKEVEGNQKNDEIETKSRGPTIEEELAEATLAVEVNVEGAVDLPVLATGGTSTSLPVTAGVSSFRLPRSVQAFLLETKFPEIVDSDAIARYIGTTAHGHHKRNPDKFATVPPGKGLLEMEKELQDCFPANEISFQFLAYSMTSAGRRAQHMKGLKGTLYVTFHFYRFGIYRSESLTLQPVTASGDSNVTTETFVLTGENGTPGTMQQYLVQPTNDGTDGLAHFIRYLDTTTLQIDVWDGKSMLLLGSGGINLRQLLRGGKGAVETSIEMRILKHAVSTDGPEWVGGGLTSRAPGSSLKNESDGIEMGTLYLRCANVGRPASSGMLPPVRSVLTLRPSRTGQIRAAKDLRARTVRRLADKVPGLAMELVHQRTATCDQSRKTLRLDTIRKSRGEEDTALSTLRPGSLALNMTVNSGPLQDPRELRTVGLFRADHKHDKISHLLSHAVTTETTISAAFGQPIYIEYVFTNPFHMERTFILMPPPGQELRLLLDADEWRHFKREFKSNCTVEADMFRVMPSGEISLYLRAAEEIRIPLVYQTFQSHADTVLATDVEGSSNKDETIRESSVVATHEFIIRGGDGQRAGVLLLSVTSLPFAIDREFRFWQSQNHFLRKTIRLAPGSVFVPWNSSRHNKPKLEGVRSSNNDVICEALVAEANDPQDIVLKYACGPSPEVASFYVALFSNQFLSEISEIWLVHVHSLERIEMSGTLGQVTGNSITLAKSHCSRKVQLFSSDPDVRVIPSDPFMLVANSIRVIGLEFHPEAVGSRHHFVTVVDVEFSQVLNTYLVVTTCHQPQVTKSFEISVPAKTVANKRVSYRNAYPMAKRFHLKSDRPDLVVFKSPCIEIDGGESAYIAMRFESKAAGVVEHIYIFIYDDDGKSEECFSVKVFVDK